MADIMDYIDWRGDIGFDEVHVNEVDGLIFSQLIYVQMKPYMPDAKKSYLTIKQLSSFTARTTVMMRLSRCLIFFAIPRGCFKSWRTQGAMLTAF